MSQELEIFIENNTNSIYMSLNSEKHTRPISSPSFKFGKNPTKNHTLLQPATPWKETKAGY